MDDEKWREIILPAHPSEDTAVQQNQYQTERLVARQERETAPPVLSDYAAQCGAVATVSAGGMATVYIPAGGAA